MRRMVSFDGQKAWSGYAHKPFPTTGAGAFLAPIVATQFAQLPRWSFHYLVSLGIAIANIIFLALVFGFKSQDGTCTTLVFVYALFRNHRIERRMPVTNWPSTRRERNQRA